MKKSEFYQTIKTLTIPGSSEPAFVIDGRYYRANGVYMAPEEVKRHKGTTIQFSLTDEPMPEAIEGATLFPVDSWVIAGDLAREALGVKSVSLSRGKHLEYLDSPPAGWVAAKEYYQTHKYCEK